MRSNIPVFLWGAPGIGKSSVVKQICVEENYQFIDLRLSLLNPIDLRGIPHISKDQSQAVWLKPDFLPTEGKGVLFLDELNIAPISTQQAAYQLLLDRRIGNYIFPDGWKIIAAGNREKDVAYVNKMPAPLANRLIHLELEANFADWKIWAMGKIDARVVNFLNFRPKLLSTEPKEEVKAFPTPRAWEFVSIVLQLYQNSNDAEEVVAGIVGEGTSKEFIKYIDVYQKLPDIDGILKGTVKTVPKEQDVLYAVCQALASKVTIENVEHFITYACLLQAEHSTMMMKDAVKRKDIKDAIRSNPMFKTWAKKYTDYL